jgi:hypothetical protein
LRSLPIGVKRADFFVAPVFVALYVRGMPEISRFLGIVIAMYYRDHSPPHFHAVYGEFEATIEIRNGAVSGRLPMRALAHVQEWRRLHQSELLSAWNLARAEMPLPRIQPLE